MSASESMSAPIIDARRRLRATQPSKPSQRSPNGTSANAAQSATALPVERYDRQRKMAAVPDAALPMVKTSGSAYERSIEKRRVAIGFCETEDAMTLTS